MVCFIFVERDFPNSEKIVQIFTGLMMRWKTRK